MKSIKEIADYIAEELEGAEEYAKNALMRRDDDKALADMYYGMSMDEMRHANLLHDQGVRLINDFSANGGVVPAQMKAVYDYLHEKNIEHASKIKAMQDQYKSRG